MPCGWFPAARKGATTRVCAPAEDSAGIDVGAEGAFFVERALRFVSARLGPVFGSPGGPVSTFGHFNDDV